MAGVRSTLLERAWTEAQEGCLSAWSQAKVWALREVWNDEHESAYGLFAWVASRVTKEGGGHPSSEAVAKLYKKMDADPAWYPGKSEYACKGPPRQLLKCKAAAIAKSAMTMKKKGAEPTYAKVVAACPTASINPSTGQPFGKKRVYQVLRERCFDETPEKPWDHKARYSKAALTDGQVAKRFKFAQEVQEKGHSDSWYYNSVVWTDLCNSVLPTSEQKATEQALARKGAKGWCSKGSELASNNLRGRKEVLKQSSWNTQKVWWAPILTRGKLHVVTFDDTFPGEEPAAATVLVPQLLVAVNKRFPNAGRKPSWVFVDRGKGFYNPGNGRITPEFQKALKDSGFKAFWGDNASAQPGHMQEVMLHETAVSWLRRRLTESLPARCWEETPAAFAARLRAACAHVNANYNVEGLCREFPSRIQQLIDHKGGRLKQ